MTNDELLHKWINKSISNEELEIFKLRPEFNSLVELYTRTEGLSIPAFDGNQMLEEILDSKKGPEIKKITQVNQRSFNLAWIKYGVAASVLIVAMFLLRPKNTIVNYNLADSQQLEGVLPDNSEFVLYENSQLSYDKSKWPSARIVKLEGEVLLNVKKGKPFKVETSNGAVEVLGTKFKVNSLENELAAECQEGRIRVTNTELKYTEVLVPGESMIIQNTSSKTWKKNLTKLKNVTLATATKELERLYNIEITSESINMEEPLSCNFPNNNLEMALKTTFSTLNLKYEFIEKNKIKLFK